jgi:hypothetical protein
MQAAGVRGGWLDERRKKDEANGDHHASAPSVELLHLVMYGKVVSDVLSLASIILAPRSDQWKT